MAKRNFAERAWDDPQIVVQLLDHFEGSAILGSLQFISIALDCFSRRKTDQFAKADIVYALMGLLNKRLQANKEDTGFQAFARLSLANDSDQLLERTLCMLPPDPDAPWYEIQDAYGANLWDIKPNCEITKVMHEQGNHQTLSLYGAYGATIHWDSLDPICFRTDFPLIGRRWAIILLRLPAIWIFMAISFVCPNGLMQSIGKSSEGTIVYTFLASVTFFPSVIGLLAVPAIVKSSRFGALRSTQARFVGIEGDVAIGIIERYLFGFNHGRLRESEDSSTLTRSRYYDNPTTADTNSHEDTPGMQLFTLVDTYTMTVTRFLAERPPVAVLVGSQDKGMQRAVLYSYEHRTRTFCRQTVLRMKSAVLERMVRMDRVRFTLQRTLQDPRIEELRRDGSPQEDQQGETSRRRDTSSHNVEQGPPNGSRADDRAGPELLYPPIEQRGFVSKIDLAFIPVMWVSDTQSPVR